MAAKCYVAAFERQFNEGKRASQGHGADDEKRLHAHLFLLPPRSQRLLEQQTTETWKWREIRQKSLAVAKKVVTHGGVGCVREGVEESG